MDNTDNILLEVKNLKTCFNTEQGIITAVNNVSFTVNRGETVGIVGESGSGKSVTSLSIMKLLPKDTAEIVEGEVWLNSPKHGRINLLEKSNKEMRKIRGKEISMIFQEPMTSLNPVFKCGKQLIEAAAEHLRFEKKMLKEIVMELIEVVQLPNPERIFNSYPHELSGGQKQRVMIAMAMVCNPGLLIADEPTTALDVTVQKSILDLMKRLRKDIEMSIMFITHDLGVIAEIADKVIVMYKGNIVEQGPVWEIFSNPKHPYTKGLIACKPRLEMNLKKLPTISDFMTLGEDGQIIENHDLELESDEFIRTAEDLYSQMETQREYYQTKPFLVLDDLQVQFKVKSGLLNRTTSIIKAVDKISLNLYKGETVGLVGESGCGKSTLGRAILGLVETCGGKVMYRDEEVSKLKPHQWRKYRKDLQIIFQDPYSSLNPRKTIGNAIIEPMIVHKIYATMEECKENALELLKKVGLSPDHYNRFPHEFSGGQRQRICIARALAVKPSFIICDESVSALDVSVQAQVLNLLNDLKKEFELTYIFVSHDLSVVKFMADRILVMNKGKMEELEFSQDLYKKPESSYTKKLIEAIPQGRLEDVRRSVADREHHIMPTS